MLLAIDSATCMLSLALHDGQRIRAEFSWETANRHTVELTPAIGELCQRAGITVQTLTQIAVAQGPGSFSGLRIGIGVAKGLAMALAIPLIAVPTLDIVAAAQPAFKGTLIAVAQVGRGRVCAERFSWHKTSWIAANDVEILTWEALIAAIDNKTSGEVIIAGEIDTDARALIAASDKAIHLSAPALNLRRASVLADLALTHTDAPNDPAAVVPLYVNQPGLPHP